MRYNCAMPRDASEPPDLVHVPVEVLIGMNAMVVYQAQMDVALRDIVGRLERLDGRLDGHIREVGPAVAAFGEFARSATSHAMENAAEAAGNVLSLKAEAEAAREAARAAEAAALAAEEKAAANARRSRAQLVGALLAVITLLAAAVAHEIVDRFNQGESSGQVDESP